MAKLNLESRKKLIVEQQHIVNLIEEYSPTTLEQRIIHEYLIEGSVTIVAKKINDDGYRIGSRKYISNDISEILMRKPENILHEIARKTFQKNKKSARYLT